MAKEYDTGIHNLLAQFPWLTLDTLNCGRATIHVWGHGQLSECYRLLSPTDCWFIVGRTSTKINWDGLLASEAQADNVVSSWNGRYVAVKVSEEADSCTIWNDWVGSIPVFHAKVIGSSVISTCEPIVARTLGYDQLSIAPASLITLLLNGHFLGEWTLYEEIRALPADVKAVWKNNTFRFESLQSLIATQDRWHCGWDELTLEMSHFLEDAIKEATSERSNWLLPLSGGMDSRLTAVIGKKLGLNLTAYTYGPPYWAESIYARQVAWALGLTWHRVDLGVNYLAEETVLWAEWFGSSMHFHGMYQFPFLRNIEKDHQQPILHGYMGDPLAGNHLLALAHTHNTENPSAILTSSWTHWQVSELEDLLKIPFKQGLTAVKQKIAEEIETSSGTWFQKLMFLDFRNRQRSFISYHPSMYDYWFGVETPFLNREYARFCLSLPRVALEERRLQFEMLKRYYPEVATIGGTFGTVPLKLTRKHLLRRGIAEVLPKPFRVGALKEFSPARNTLDQDAMRTGGSQAIWPVSEVWDRMEQWLNMDKVRDTYRAAALGDAQAVNKIEAIQPLALYLLRTN